MPTPTPEKISIHYASKGLAADGTPTERTVHSITNAMVFRINNISEATGFWDGAVGYFTNTQTVALRGKNFHVRYWDKETDNLTLSAPLPAQPVSGDKFILFAGGKQASTKEVLCMLAGGKQPEIETVTGTNVTGVTLKKISPLLGVGTAIVDQVRLTGGSWTGGDATGRLILKKWLTNFSFSTSYGIMVGGERYATPSTTSVRGFRDCAAQQWTTAHVVVPASDIDLGLEIPGESGFFSDPVTENV